MRSLTIKNLIEFRGKSARSKKNFVTNLMVDKVKLASEGGGDYWISCLSAISNSYKLNDLEAIKDKIDELKAKMNKTDSTRIKTMYSRNIEILSTYQDFDLKKWRATKKVVFQKKHKENSVLIIRGLQIQITPHHVFTILGNDKKEVGAIWFIAKLNGFRIEELAMFSDLLYRYLKLHFSQQNVLNPKYCIAVDVFKKCQVDYLQIERKEIPSIVNSTLNEIRKLM